MKTHIQFVLIALLFVCSMYLNRAWAQTTTYGPGIGGVTAVTSGPYGGRNAYAAGYSVANVIQPVFPTYVPGVITPYVQNPNVLVGPLPTTVDLMNVVVPFVDLSFFGR